MKILIIGNGFDLNLGLKTSYKDFVESSHFSKLVESGNVMAKYFNDKNKLNNWVDIEKEITNFSNIVQEENLKLREDFDAIKNALMNYLKEAQSKELNYDSKAYKMIKEEILTIDRILNFNYTDTIFRIADMLKINNLEDKHCYIHGSISEKEIVFGVEDDARVREGHIFFKKASYKNYGKHDVNSYLKKENEIIVFGHSLGITDSAYFKEYINHRSHVHNNGEYLNFTFYYYGESGWYEMIDIIDKYSFHNLTGFRANNFNPIDSSF